MEQESNIIQPHGFVVELRCREENVIVKNKNENTENKKDLKIEEKETGDHKYQNLGMSTGMCLGLALGISLGSLYDNLTMGMLYGMLFGMVFGMLVGRQKDKKIEETACTIKEIVEDDFGCEGIPEGVEAMVTVVLLDKEGNEKSVRVSDKLVYEKNMKAGDKVAVKEDGTLEVLGE